MESEKLIEKNLVLLVKKLGGLSVKLVALHFSGLPDRLILLPGGRFIFMELKSEGKKPSKIQKIIHKRFEALGFPVFVGDTWGAVKDKIYEVYGEQA